MIQEWQSRGFYTASQIEDAGGKEYSITSNSQVNTTLLLLLFELPTYAALVSNRNCLLSVWCMSALPLSLFLNITGRTPAARAPRQRQAHPRASSRPCFRSSRNRRNGKTNRKLLGPFWATVSHLRCCPRLMVQSHSKTADPQLDVLLIEETITDTSTASRTRASMVTDDGVVFCQIQPLQVDKFDVSLIGVLTRMMRRGM